MSGHTVDVKQLGSYKCHNAFMNVREPWNGVGVQATATYPGGGVLVLVKYTRSVWDRDKEPFIIGFYKFESAETFFYWWLESSKHIVELEFL